jgi:sodium/bile acid cotransporter 7
VFFVQGLVLAFEALRTGLWRWRLHGVVQLFTYVLIPVLGLALDAIGGRWLPEELRLGFLFLAVLPTTISSAVVFTALAGGNTAGALVNTTMSNLLGVVATPLWVSVLLHVRGEAPPLWPMVQGLLLLVLAPLVLGQLVRPLLCAWADRHRARLTQLNSIIVLYIVYAAFCSSVSSHVWTEHGWELALVALAGAVILLATVLALVFAAVRLAGLASGDRIAAVFCASQKTLAAGAPMAKLIFAANPGLSVILLPVMFYHPLQLIVSGALVNVFRRQHHASKSEILPPT